MTEIYRIALQGPPSQPSRRKSIEFITELTNAAHIVRAIHPALKLIAFSRACSVDIVNWETKENVTISMASEELDELVRMDINRNICVSQQY